MRWDQIPITAFLANDIPIEVAEQGKFRYENDDLEMKPKLEISEPKEIYEKLK